MQQFDADAQGKAKDLPDNAVSLTRVHTILDEFWVDRATGSKASSNAQPSWWQSR
jgi:hypothetical protein